MNAPNETRDFTPALRFRFLTRFYDRLIAATLKEAPLKARLVAEVAAKRGERVLDLGCGTGTLTLMLKRATPEASVVGLDADEEVLERARRKATEEGLEVELVRGMSTSPPFPPGSFDHVVTSLMLHHLDRVAKERTLAAVRALLRPGGTLHVLDWGKAHGPLMRTAFLAVQLLDGFATTTDNVQGRLPELMVRAGFDGVRETLRARTVFGTVSIYAAKNSRDPSGIDTSRIQEREPA